MELKQVSRSPESAEAGLDTDIQARLGRELQAYYDKLVGEPLPDRLNQLLAQLDEHVALSPKASPSKKGSGSASRNDE